ncbi:hypothetical protein MRX96_034800 [Rhipicephalus microplus]
MLAARAKTAWLPLLLLARFAAAALNDTGIELRGALHSSAAGDLDRYKTAGACDATVDSAEGLDPEPQLPERLRELRHVQVHGAKAGQRRVHVAADAGRFRAWRRAPDCFNDYLLLPDGQKLCGSLPPDTLNPLFPTDSQPEDFTPLGRPQAQFGNAGGCDRDVLGYTHVLSSPGYPYGYPPNQYCLYRVWRADSSVCLLELDVRDFELNQRDCFRDYLDLPDGTQFCGQVSGTKLLEFTPGSETLRLKFVSDAYGSGKGFNVFLRQRPNSCRGQVPLGIRGTRSRDLVSIIRGSPPGAPFVADWWWFSGERSSSPTKRITGMAQEITAKAVFSTITAAGHTRSCSVHREGRL